jgi:RNA polymerase sigma-70 factor, ECF subfamily
MHQAFGRGVGEREVSCGEQAPDTIAAIRAGDVKAFEAFFREVAPRVVAFITRLLGSRSDAEEVVQEVFSTLWTQRATLHVRESLTTYVFAAARNRALNVVVRTQRRAKLASDSLGGDESVVPDISDTVVERELAEALNRAVLRLPARCREVFVLSRRHGLTYEQIAARLHLSLKTVERHMGRALKQIRRSLVGHL